MLMPTHQYANLSTLATDHMIMLSPNIYLVPSTHDAELQYLWTILAQGVCVLRVFPPIDVQHLHPIVTNYAARYEMYILPMRRVGCG